MTTLARGPSPSAKREWFGRLARPYVRSRLRRTFAEVSVAGLEGVRAALERGPLLIAPNHVAWWDPLLCVALDERLGGGGHCLMDAANLRALPFFAWVGALPLERAAPRRAYADLASAARVLRGPGDFLIVFPQGAQRPAHLPLSFQPGVSWLARRLRLPVVPVGLRYEFGEGPRPRLFVSFGAGLEMAAAGDTERAARADFLRRLEGGVTAELGRIDAELLRRLDDAHRPSHFQALFPVAEAAELPWGTRWLARLARGEGGA